MGQKRLIYQALVKAAHDF